MSEDNAEFFRPEDKKFKRRSSFFRRSFSSNSYNSESPTDCGVRATLPPQGCSVRATLPQQGNVASYEEDSEYEYLYKLEKEKEDWKDLSDEMKKTKADLRDKCPQAASSEAFLTEEDKKFLADRPDYAAIGRLLDNVIDSVAIKQRRLDSTMERVDNFVTLCEEVTNNAAARVVDRFMVGFDEFGDGAPES